MSASLRVLIISYDSSEITLHEQRNGQWAVTVGFPLNRGFHEFHTADEALLFAKDRIKEHLCASTKEEM